MAEPNFFDQFDGSPTPTQALEAPEGANYFDQFDEEKDVEDMTSEEVQKKTYAERSMGTLQEAGTSISDALAQGVDTGYDTSNIDPATMDALGAPTFGPQERVQTALSDTLSAASNIVVDGGLTLLQSIVPDSMQDFVIGYSRQAWDEIAQTPVMREGIALAQAGAEEYAAWAKENPNHAKRLEESINIGALGKARRGTKGTRKEGEMRTEQPNYTPRRGETYLKKNKKDQMNNRKAQARDLIAPDNYDPKNGSYYEGTDGTVRWDPNTWVKETMDEMVKVKDMNHKKSYVHNMNAMREKSQSFKIELDELVLTKGGAVDKQSLKTGLANSVNALEKEVLLSGDAEAIARKIYAKTTRLIDEYPGDSAGILEVRRELDKWVNSQKSVFDSNFESATTIALRDIRGALNDTVSKTTKSTKVDGLLKRQHKLLTAADMLEEKAARQADGLVGRYIQKFEKATGHKIPTTPLAQAATVGAATAVAGVPGLATAGGLIATYKGAKWLFSVDGKRWLSQMVQLSDTIPALKPEINALIQFSEGLNPEEEPVDE
jgi:hypothetical protein